MVQVTITIDNGNITVAKTDVQQDASQDPNAQYAMSPQQSQTPDADGDTDSTQGTPVPDLKSALLLAAKILMSDDTKSTYDQAFDQGMAKNQPGNFGAAQ